MEPASALSGISYVVKALEYIEQKTKEAALLAPDDARYYMAYIDIASASIRGLQDECVAILIQATDTSPSDQDKVQALLARMKTYFFSEVLRPKLQDAIDHLRIGHDVLQEHSSARFIWKSVRSRRGAALEQYEGLLSRLTQYRESLGRWQGQSGAALNDLQIVYNAFVDGNGRAQEHAEDLLLRLNKTYMFQVTSECAQTIEMLRIAFR